MPEDARPVTVGDLRDFKEDLRRELVALQARVETLATGQTNLALQFSDSRREESEKRAALQKEIMTARVEEVGKTGGLNVKVAVLWAAGGALLMAALGYIVSVMKSKP